MFEETVINMHETSTINSILCLIESITITLQQLSHTDSNHSGKLETDITFQKPVNPKV